MTVLGLGLGLGSLTPAEAEGTPRPTLVLPVALQPGSELCPTDECRYEQVATEAFSQPTGAAADIAIIRALRTKNVELPGPVTAKERIDAIDTAARAAAIASQTAFKLAAVGSHVLNREALATAAASSSGSSDYTELDGINGVDGSNRPDLLYSDQITGSSGKFTVRLQTYNGSTGDQIYDTRTHLAGTTVDCSTGCLPYTQYSRAAIFETALAKGKGRGLDVVISSGGVICSDPTSGQVPTFGLNCLTDIEALTNLDIYGLDSTGRVRFHDVFQGKTDYSVGGATYSNALGFHGFLKDGTAPELGALVTKENGELIATNANQIEATIVDNRTEQLEIVSGHNGTVRNVGATATGPAVDDEIDPVGDLTGKGHDDYVTSPPQGATGPWTARNPSDGSPIWPHPYQQPNTYSFPWTLPGANNGLDALASEPSGRSKSQEVTVLGGSGEPVLQTAGQFIEGIGSIDGRPVVAVSESTATSKEVDLIAKIYKYVGSNPLLFRTIERDQPISDPGGTTSYSGAAFEAGYIDQSDVEAMALRFVKIQTTTKPIPDGEEIDTTFTPFQQYLVGAGNGKSYPTNPNDSPLFDSAVGPNRGDDMIERDDINSGSKRLNVVRFFNGLTHEREWGVTTPPGTVAWPMAVYDKNGRAYVFMESYDMKDTLTVTAIAKAGGFLWTRSFGPNPMAPAERIPDTTGQSVVVQHPRPQEAPKPTAITKVPPINSKPYPITKTGKVVNPIPNAGSTQSYFPTAPSPETSLGTILEFDLIALGAISLVWYRRRRQRSRI